MAVAEARALQDQRAAADAEALAAGAAAGAVKERHREALRRCDAGRER